MTETTTRYIGEPGFGKLQTSYNEPCYKKYRLSLSILISLLVGFTIGYYTNDNDEKSVNGTRSLRGSAMITNYTQVELISDPSGCNSIAYCNFNGVCNNTGLPDHEYPGICVCDSDWAGDRCDYKRKSQTTAFILQFFFGWTGGGYFYIHRDLMGMGQCILFWVPIILPIIIGLCKPDIVDTIDDIKSSCLYYIWYISISVWWLVTLIQFGINNIPDQHGEGLAPW